jgi:hypothetical protein
MPVSVTITGPRPINVSPVSSNSPTVLTEISTTQLTILSSLGGPPGPPGTSYLGGEVFIAEGVLTAGDVPVFDGTNWTNGGVIKGGTF